MIEVYEHHGKLVSVQSNLKGRHAEHCLCWQNCEFFKPNDRKNNCEIANVMFAIDCAFDIVTPVWECHKYLQLNYEVKEA
jgi:hypothetical protein